MSTVAIGNNSILYLVLILKNSTKNACHYVKRCHLLAFLTSLLQEVAITWLTNMLPYMKVMRRAQPQLYRSI